jgi:hypothetical protein
LRHVLVAVVCGSALWAAAGGGAAPAAVDARSCAQRSSFFNVQILGDKDAVRWTSLSIRPLASVPKGKTVAVVWSLGGPRSTNGMAVYGWMTDTQSRFAFHCSRVRAAQKTSSRGLRAPGRVKDGWHYGLRFACLQRGNFVVEVRDLSGGQRMTVRMQRSGEVIAIAEAKPGGGWIRASKRCEERSA